MEMYEVTKRSIALAGALLLAAAASAPAAEPVGPKLTPKLRDALRQEMASVLLASQDIVGALAIGDHATVAERAQQIHDSFILQQSLTEQDRKDLMAAVPPEFVELDRSPPRDQCRQADETRGRSRAMAVPRGKMEGYAEV